MDQFPPNSQKAKQPEAPQRIERVTSGEAVRRKQGIGSKLKSTFIEGSIRGALLYMFDEVMVPAIRDLMVEALQGGVDRLFRGEGRPRRSGGGGIFGSYPNVGHFDYQRASQGTQTKASTQRSLSRTARARHDFQDIIINTRQEAEEVLEMMYTILSTYGSVTVFNLYDLTGIRGDHTDHKWGWNGLDGARLARLRDGRYVLELPQPEALG